LSPTATADSIEQQASHSLPSEDTKPQEDRLLEMFHVRVQFGSTVAVRDVSLSLGPQNLLGLIGPNGAGKTTLLRAAAGLQPLTAGYVTIMGEPVLPGALAAKWHIGFTADNPSVYQELTVRDYLTFIGKAYGLSRAETHERSDFWLEKVWLYEKRNEKIKSLSRGMRQRIGIARTMVPNPNVVFLDEPAAGLDPAGRVQFRELLCSMRDQGKALIVSSHILADLDEYCTHIAIMAKGSIVQFGTVDEVTAGGDGRTCRYEIMLAQPLPDITQRLNDIEGITSVKVDRHRISLVYHSDRNEAAALLSQLVEARIPVASFRPMASNLEEAYLKTGIRQVD
jgi:ABC-2 type transport system ATP-binding protein